MAMELLNEKNYNVLLFHPIRKEIDGYKVYNNFNNIDVDIDTITLYVNAEKSQKMSEQILNINPKRIIFNPGTENSNLKNKAKNKNIETMNACTILMLKTGQF